MKDHEEFCSKFCKPQDKLSTFWFLIIVGSLCSIFLFISGFLHTSVSSLTEKQKQDMYAVDARIDQLEKRTADRHDQILGVLLEIREVQRREKN